MKKETFFILVLMIAGIGMVIWTFFGGSSNSTPEIIDSGTGFINTLTNSGTTLPESIDTSITITGNITTDNNDTNKLIEIQLAMPSYFYNAGRRSFAQNLYKEQNIYINFQLIDDLKILYDTSINNFSGYDILLIPYDRINKDGTRSVNFGQDISSEFDPLVYNLVKNSSIGFLPFSADPMVIYNLSGYLNQNTFSEILQLSYNRTAPKARAFPLFFGITYDDSFQEGFYREYKDIVRFALMHYFINSIDTIGLDSWLENNAFDQYNTTTLNEILSILTKSVPYCKEYPSICFQLYNFVGIRFGFLSDSDIVKQFFSKKYSHFLENQIQSVPFFSLESPVRIRGFTSSKSLTDKNKIKGVNAFLIQYMNKHNKYPLRNSTLSVFQSEGNLKDNEFIGKKGYILTEGGNFIQNMSNKDIFRDLINYQLSASNYFKKI